MTTVLIVQHSINARNSMRLDDAVMCLQHIDTIVAVCHEATVARRHWDWRVRTVCSWMTRRETYAARRQ